MYPGTFGIGTSPSPPTQLPALPGGGPVQSATYSRDFEATCPAGTSRKWRGFTWTAVEPLDSKIVFTAQTAEALTDLAAAPSLALATAAQGDASPATHSIDVAPVLAAPMPHKRWLRVSMRLDPSTNLLAAPTIFDWNQAFDCVDSE